MWFEAEYRGALTGQGEHERQRARAEHGPWTAWPPATRWLIAIGLALSLALLLLHVLACWFLTDDAYISFRYARNFSHGLGLVFNPGFERGASGPRFAWVVLVPALCLAATRSVAVWSTSGLETRWFEMLIVAAVLRLVIEIEARIRHQLPRSLSPWLFALAVRTRPDGLLLTGAAFGAAAPKYLAAFALEYGAYLWIPPLVAGVIAPRWRWPKRGARRP